MKDSAYKQAGVDIAAGDNLVERLKPHIAKTKRSGLMGSVGGFGALFDLQAVKDYERPILVSGTDGVGTKLKIALEMGNHKTIGTDCVAMCVNDVVVQGAEPLYFLDYYACGRLDVDIAESVIAGVAEGCRQAGCALIGGETAEMPGMYQEDDYDLAGFTVGVVEKEAMIDGSNVDEGDVIFGLASDGVHSNGFSLVRKIIQDNDDVSLNSAAYFTGDKTLGDELLTPTRIYVKSLLKALCVLDDAGKPAIRAMAHITGGGLPGNVVRVIPENLSTVLDCKAWRSLPVFKWLMDKGNLTASDMLETFNCGIGMAVVVSADYAEAVRHVLALSEQVFEIGHVRKRKMAQSTSEESGLSFDGCDILNVNHLCQSTR